MPGVKKIEEAHVTHRVRVEIQATSRAVGLEAQEAFSECIREEFPQLLERWFEARFPPGTRWRKERLELNLGRVSARNLRTDLARVLAAALDSIERSIVNETGRSGRGALPEERFGEQRFSPEHQEGLHSLEREPIVAFVHFLRTGTLPWWFPLARWQTEVPDALLEDEMLAALRPEIHLVLGEKPALGVRLLVYRRLLRRIFETEFPPMAAAEGFRKLIGELPEKERARLELALLLTYFSPSGEASAALKGAIQNLAKLGTEGARNSWMSAIAEAARESSLQGLETAKVIRQVAEMITRDSDVVKFETSVVTVSEPAPEGRTTTEEGLPTEASGLVILHPFLPQFFKLLGWLSPAQRLLPARRWHATQSLHWLAHGRLARDEAEVALEKTLCGIELSEAGELPELEPMVLEEGLELLRSVISHWSALRNTSPDGLREAFLARPGVLYAGEKNVLRVEGRGYDLLLRRLPYSIETVLLPWLKQPLQVEWENV